MKKHSTVQQVVDDFYDGNLTWGEVPGLLMHFIDDNNVDKIINDLPQELREWFVAWAHEAYCQGDDFIYITKGEPVDPIPKRALDAIRAWMARNPSGRNSS
jgi:hypothetical protein